MNFSNKKKIVLFKSRDLLGKIQLISLFISFPLSWMHELLHILFAKLFNRFNHYKIIDNYNITGYNMSFCLETQVNVDTTKNYQLIQVLIVFVSPLLIPFIMYYIFGIYGLFVCILLLNSWKLSEADIIAINECYKQLKTNLKT